MEKPLEEKGFLVLVGSVEAQPGICSSRSPRIAVEELSTKILEGFIGQLGRSDIKNEKLLKCERIEFFIYKKKWIYMVVFQELRYYIKRHMRVSHCFFNSKYFKS